MKKLSKKFRSLKFQKWDCALEAAAQKWADRCINNHSDEHGESIGWVDSEGKLELNGKHISLNGAIPRVEEPFNLCASLTTTKSPPFRFLKHSSILPFLCSKYCS